MRVRGKTFYKESLQWRHSPERAEVAAALQLPVANRRLRGKGEVLRRVVFMWRRETVKGGNRVAVSAF
jgi:hypothetical protein